VVWNTDIKMNQIDQMLGLRGNHPPGRKPQPATIRQQSAALVFADSARDAAGLFGKLQSPFDQPCDRVARQIRMVLPDGFCVALPSVPLRRPSCGA
jgi:hypothetical protein